MGGWVAGSRYLLTLLLTLAPWLDSPAFAQHATAFDIENGARAYQGTCAACHGPDGNLIAGIDFGRGAFRRAYTDDEIARIIIGGIPNTPMPPSPAMSQEQALQIVAYLRSMRAARSTRACRGDAARGRAIVRRLGRLHRVPSRRAATGSAHGPGLEPHRARLAARPSSSARCSTRMPKCSRTIASTR